MDSGSLGKIQQRNEASITAVSSVRLGCVWGCPSADAPGLLQPSLRRAKLLCLTCVLKVKSPTQRPSQGMRPFYFYYYYHRPAQLTLTLIRHQGFLGGLPRCRAMWGGCHSAERCGCIRGACNNALVVVLQQHTKLLGGIISSPLRATVCPLRGCFIFVKMYPVDSERGRPNCTVNHNVSGLHVNYSLGKVRKM